MTRRYQVWFSHWFDGRNRTPERPAFGGTSYPTRTAAWEAWYDSDPGCNDHAVVVEVLS